ncbi:uncharacterized protein LOC108090207 [Drosophila ficusphila]|uniref:uncharacterized protein LOC108090207 n=1 Tax=Drosophila ficusphila TaxID=30025 RepID=UPI0007E620A6|nr:uncharacterized protein LOC108090207 [Drosophila ficusphila]
MSEARPNQIPSSLATFCYPKPIPEIKVGPVEDVMGFTLSERLALKSAWNLIRPYQRRIGQDVFYSYLNDAYWGICLFKTGKEINLRALHLHAVQFVRFFGLLIEERDPVMFQLLVTDNNHTHRRCKVGSADRRNLVQVLVDYLLREFHKVSSPSLERGFRKIAEKLLSYQDHEPIPSTDNRRNRKPVGQSNVKASLPRGSAH